METVITNTKTPLLIQNTLNWELLKWDLNKWKEILYNEKLVFHCGKNYFTEEPQFENYTGVVEMTFEEFLNVKTEAEWYYFDYKYLKDWLINCDTLRTHICWKDFGFPDLNVDDSTIWIGSSGAHTPCHVDSYGCNIIAQIYGRKRWMLFPPEEDLQSTRIPYEESSIFSNINFFSPSSANLLGVKNCYSIVLNPGDVLIVPHKWWHYVENLDLAISINAWIKLSTDYEERVKEAIVRMTFLQHLKGLHPDIQKELLIANVEPNLLDETPLESITLIINCLKQFKEHKMDSPQPNMVNNVEMLKNFPNIKEIQPLLKENFEKLIEHQYNRFMKETKNHAVNVSETTTNNTRDLKKVMDAIVHSDVIQLIYKKLSEY